VSLQAMLAAPGNFEAQARLIIEQMALCVSASLLLRNAPAAVADAYCTSRLAGGHGMALGTLPGGMGLKEIVDRVGVI
jgi:putative acyl-CoA dehydrogenase